MSQTNPSVTTNGNHQPLSMVIEDDPAQLGGAFYDPTNPQLAAPRQVDLTKRKGRHPQTNNLVLHSPRRSSGCCCLVTY